MRKMCSQAPIFVYVTNLTCEYRVAVRQGCQIKISKFCSPESKFCFFSAGAKKKREGEEKGRKKREGKVRGR